MSSTLIRDIYNYYGNLQVKGEGGKYYWGIGDWGDFKWKEIPKSLYEELLKHNTEGHS